MPAGAVRGLLDPVDQLAFVIGLAEIDRQPEPLARRGAVGLDVGKGLAAIDGRLALAEHVEIWSVEDKDRDRHPPNNAAAQAPGKGRAKIASL